MLVQHGVRRGRGGWQMGNARTSPATQGHGEHSRIFAPGEYAGALTAGSSESTMGSIRQDSEGET